MHSILEEFAYGNISPEAQYFKHGTKFGEAMKSVSTNEEKLLRILDGEAKIIFEKYNEAQGEVNQLTAVKNLVYGYKLGLLMTAETFITSGDLVAGEEEL